MVEMCASPYWEAHRSLVEVWLKFVEVCRSLVEDYLKGS